MTIKNYTPENDAKTLYILGDSIGINDLIERIKAHFGDDVNMDNITITGTKIHTRCITYDLYDPTDYDNYLIIEKTA